MNNEATGKKLQLDGWRRNGVMGFDLLTKEGNNPGYLQLELNDSKDGYDIVLYWNTGTGSEKLKTYRNFEHFEKDALLQLMYKDNSNSLHYIWKEKVLDLDVGHRIYIHRGIEVNKNQTGTLNLSWDSDLYPARSIGRGVASYNAPIRFEVDKITDDNGDLILHFKGKIVGKIDSAYFIRDGGETYRVNVKKYDAKNKEWTEYATLELPPI